MENVHLKDRVESRFRIKTWIENDMNAIVLAEKKFGQYGGFQNLIYISMGGGVGAGVILGDSVLRGSRGGAGEFGHTTVNSSGLLCECGNRGCLENYISWPAIRARIANMYANAQSPQIHLWAEGTAELTPADFYRAVEDGDSIANKILDETVTYMGVGIVNLVNLFNPDIIIIGGEMVGEDGILLAKLQDYIKRHALGFSTEGLQICNSSLGENEDIIGAAAVLLQDYFQFSLSSEH